MPTVLSLCCFLFSFLSFSFFLLSYFLSTLFFFRVLPLFFDPCSRHSGGLLIVHAVTRLLFCPLITFVWSRCTCRPPLVRLHHPPQLQTKKRLFYLLACHGALSCHSVGIFSLDPSWHAPNGSSLNLASFRWSVIPAGCTSQKSLGRSRKIGLFPFPHHQTIPHYLWPMTPPSPILAGYRLVVPGLHACSPLTYV